MSTVATVTETKFQRANHIKTELLTTIVADTIITRENGGRVDSRYMVNYKGVEYSRDRKTQHIWANQGALGEKVIKFNTGFSLKLFVAGVANYLIENALA